MGQLIKLSSTDIRIIFRDSVLRTFLFLPLLIFLIVLLVFPLMVEKFPATNNYISYFLMAALIQTPQIFGFIYGLILIEEKETAVAKMYGVLPISKYAFLSFRMLFPFLYSFLFTIILLQLQTFVTLSIGQILVLSLLTSLVGIIYAIAMTNLSKNKLIGMTWIKVLNSFNMIPLLAFFVPEQFKLLFAAIPSYWVFQTVDNYFNNVKASFIPILGFIWMLCILAFLMYRFVKKHFSS